MKYEDDNLIDWSAFDEKTVRTKPVSGCGILRALSILLFVLGAGGCVLGGMEAGAALDVMSKATDQATVYQQADYAGRGAVLVIISLATLLPGAFGLQMAANPSMSTTPLILGILGILVPGAAFAWSLISEAANSGVADFRLIAFCVAALLYVAIVVLVRMNVSYGGGAHSGKHSKEALWDEKEIWK